MVINLKILTEIENGLRRHGIEGENAFYVLVYYYASLFKSKFQHSPKDILKIGQSNFNNLVSDKKIHALLESVISADVSGENLPNYYQYFLGRKFREKTGKFFTPRPVASAMASLIPKKRNAVIMDPACGGGTFLLQASKRWGTFPCTIIGNDTESSLVDLTYMVLTLGTSDNHKKVLVSSNVYNYEPDLAIWQGRVDYILANPPFSLPIKHFALESELLNLGYKSSDALFLEICWALLRASGRLVCLLPHSIIANNDYKKLREYLESKWNLLGVIGLPEGIFYLTANTTTRADIVVLEKKTSAKHTSPRAFFAFASSAGVPLSSRMKSFDENYLLKIVNDKKLKFLDIS